MRLSVVLLAVATLSSWTLSAEETGKNTATPARKAMPIYITPFYDSRGPTIDVGPFSKELQGANEKNILETIKKLDKEWRTLPAETMFVAAKAKRIENGIEGKY